MLATIDRAFDLWQQSPTLKLLRARHAPLILYFLHRQFKETNSLTVPNAQLIGQLANLMEDIRFQDEDNLKQLDYVGLARKYIDEWATNNYLQNDTDDATKQVVSALTKHSERAFQMLALLQEREFVGTESKFQDIFHKLRDILDNSTRDPQQRIDELQRQKQAIEAEILRIQRDGHVVIYDNTQIRSRYDDIRELYVELVGDFQEVKENFNQIKRRVMERQLQTDVSKGAVLSYAFDALDQLKDDAQGRSFYAFWHFLIDDTSTDEYSQLTQRVSAVLDERQIPHDRRFWNRLRDTLYRTGQDVVRNNQVLADKLARIITERDVAERRQIRQLSQHIQQLVVQRVAGAPEAGLVVDGEPVVWLPVERKLRFKTDEVYRSVGSPQNATDELTDDVLAPLLTTPRTDRRVLIKQVKTLLAERPIITLADVTAAYPVRQGLGEIIGYFALVGDSAFRTHVNEQTDESICFNPVQQKYILVPQLTFIR